MNIPSQPFRTSTLASLHSDSGRKRSQAIPSMFSCFVDSTRDLQKSKSRRRKRQPKMFINSVQQIWTRESFQDALGSSELVSGQYLAICHLR